ncbi:MAG TPA: acetyl-CoA carboxylase carboxyltransferase subunit alpha [Nitrospinota bacterium]|nr:acetyl-CoA carboxylase carboxyltransferase subunit alpha [Nitrospinota bacterium]
MDYLDFEEPIIKLENRIEELRERSQSDGKDFLPEIRKLRQKANRLRRDIFGKLSPWQRTKLARHPMRPYTKDYIDNMTSGFMELHGDRFYGDGVSIISGFANLDGHVVMVIGQQKGRDTKEKIKRNFGMSHPEGYRKALRLMKMAEKFNRPILTLLDTPGAYPGVGAEERGQSEAIAKNLLVMSSLRVPIISVVIGEGGSGGALALGVGDRILMLENSVYSVISPEGCAAILWNNPEKVEEAASALRLTAMDLFSHGLVDEVVKEPSGGAHRKPITTASTLRRVIRRHLNELMKISSDDLVSTRRNKIRNMGYFYE